MGEGQQGVRYFPEVPSGRLSMAHLPGVVSAGAEGYHLGLSCQSVRYGWLETNGDRNQTAEVCWPPCPQDS